MCYVSLSIFLWFVLSFLFATFMDVAFFELVVECAMWLCKWEICVYSQNNFLSVPLLWGCKIVI